MERTKKFGGKTYTFLGWNYKKSDSIRMAKGFRKGLLYYAHGAPFFARVVKEKNGLNLVYSVYARKKDRD